MDALILEVALEAARLGLSVHPPVQDGTKAPAALYVKEGGQVINGRPEMTWLHPPGERASVEQITAWYTGHRARQGVGLRLGREGDGLEGYDFDCREVYLAFMRLVEEAGLSDLVARIEAGYCEDTPNGGVHWLFRPETIRGNTKLALRPAPTADDEKARKTLIEVKGQNGYVIISPSGGTVHPSGRSYALRSGGFATIVSITDEEREALDEVARSLDEMPRDEVEEARPAATPAASSDAGEEEVPPGEDFSRKTSWAEILEPEGWTKAFKKGETQYWRRPGKKVGVSATTNHGGGDSLWVFTTSSDFACDRYYSKFAAVAALHHRGSFSDAAGALRKQGFGSPRPKRDIPSEAPRNRQNSQNGGRDPGDGGGRPPTTSISPILRRFPGKGSGYPRDSGNRCRRSRSPSTSCPRRSRSSWPSSRRR